MLRFLRSDLLQYWSIIRFKARWRKRNKHNNTLPSVVFNIDSVIVGKYTYGGLCVKNYGDTSAKLIIGNYCSIAQTCEFILAGEHPYNTVSTFPLEKYGFRSTESETSSKGNIVVEDDVWIAERVTVLSGVTIGQGAIIGAGAIVTKNVPPYAIFVGNKVIKYRFSEETISRLCRLDYDRISPEDLRKAEEFESTDAFVNSELYLKLCQ